MEQMGPKRAALRIVLGAGVVLIGVAAVVVALTLALDHYPVQQAGSGGQGADRSSAVVAVLTPVVAAIAGIVGLYFGVSATGSARGQQAQANAQVAQSAAEAVKTASEAAKSASASAERVSLSLPSVTREDVAVPAAGRAGGGAAPPQPPRGNPPRQ
jgi:uncharacterized membrane protein YcjF (UPF0283 family)